MSELQLSWKPDGTAVFVGLPLWLVAVLRELPSHLAPEQPDVVRGRLFPRPSDDEEHNVEWQRVVVPELFALIASAREIVERDLEAIPYPDASQETHTLEIPAAHVDAWISALNTTRLTLGAVHAVGQEDLESEEPPPFDERGIAIEKIQLFGLFQHLLIDGMIERFNRDADDTGQEADTPDEP